MNRPEDPRFYARLRQLSATVNRLRGWFNQFALWSGWNGNPQPVYAAVVAVEESGGIYAVSFASVPEEIYRVERSTDLISWVLADPAVAAESFPGGPTVWNSPLMFTDPVTYFRVIRGAAPQPCSGVPGACATP